jgi:hypothetical protein
MVLRPESIPVTPVSWRPTFRIIPSRFPPIQLFERVADPRDLEAVFAIEAVTNARIRAEVGELRLVPPEERISGPGSSFIMAAFTHLPPGGGRFTDGTFGAYYTARGRETAIAETVHHRQRFLREMAAPPTELDMRVLRAALSAKLHDLRGLCEAHPEVYDSADYSASQRLGRTLREAGSEGVVFASVRHEGGECAAAFRPRAISACKQAEHLGYVWDGEAISMVYEKRIVRR